ADSGTRRAWTSSGGEAEPSTCSVTVGGSSPLPSEVLSSPTVDSVVGGSVLRVGEVSEGSAVPDEPHDDSVSCTSSGLKHAASSSTAGARTRRQGSPI